MKLLLFASIVVALGAIGLGVYEYYTTKQWMDTLSETAELTQDHDVAALAVTNKFLEAHAGAPGEILSLEYTPEEYTDFAEDTYSEPLDEPSLDIEETESVGACCPDAPQYLDDDSGEVEISHEERMAAHYKKRREILVAKHGDIPEIDIKIDLTKKLAARELLTADEVLTFNELLAFFYPTEANIRRYKKLKELYEVANLSSFKMEYIE